MAEGQPVSIDEKISEEPQWSAREGIEKLFEVQGRLVNLLTPLQENPQERDHIHYGEYWYRGDTEPSDLREQALSIFNEFSEKEARASVENLYGDYFKRLGLPGEYKFVPVTSPMHGTIFKYGFTGYPFRDAQANKMIEVFPMIDFLISLEMTYESLYGNTQDLLCARIPLALNSTRFEGNVYQVFTPVGGATEDQRPERFIEYLNRHIATQPWPNSDRGIDAFQVSRRGQKLISALQRSKI